jgi:hypothetical protein
MYRRSVHRGVIHRGIIHRGIIALALVTILTLAGAQPAAAANQGILGRVAGLWSAVAGGESNSFWSRLTVWFEGNETVQPSGAPTKRGGGSDPNGRTEPTDPELTVPTSLTNDNG